MNRELSIATINRDIQKLTNPQLASDGVNTFHHLYMLIINTVRNELNNDKFIHTIVHMDESSEFFYLIVRHNLQSIGVLSEYKLPYDYLKVVKELCEPREYH